MKRQDGHKKRQDGHRKRQDGHMKRQDRQDGLRTHEVKMITMLTTMMSLVTWFDVLAN